MKFYQSGNNIIPKLIAVFMTPLWAIPLAQGVKHSNEILLLLGVVLLIITIWTFLGKWQRYVDSVTGKVVTHKKWLWFTWNDETPLSQYKYLAVVDEVQPMDSGPSRSYWHVNLVGKHSSSSKTGGFDINLNLKSFNSKEYSQAEVMQFTQEVAEALNMEIKVEARFE